MPRGNIVIGQANVRGDHAFELSGNGIGSLFLLNNPNLKSQLLGENLLAKRKLRNHPMFGFDQQKRHSFYNSSEKRPFQIASDQTPPVCRSVMTIRTDEQVHAGTPRPSNHPFGGWF
jgi:hypothetical protein